MAPGAPDEPGTAEEAAPVPPYGDRPTVPMRSRLVRLQRWLRTAAVPLGFFLFLLALVLFGLLRDDSSVDQSSVPANGSPPPALAPASTETTPPTTPVSTTVPTPPATTAAAASPPPAPPPTASAPNARSGATSPTTSRVRSRCGFAPGQTVSITINGRPASSVKAGPDGCVSVPR